jgi:TIR domain/Pentapeptide repeats (8 copies)
MADENLVAILRQGAEAWRKWVRVHFRFNQGATQWDLSGASLANANLANVDLTGAIAGGAQFNGTDLSGAHLFFAHLGGANLRGAKLTATNLAYADLSNADLSEADLTDALLIKTDLADARVSGANFTGANCGGTKFGNVDLRGAQGLEQAIHHSRSTIGIDTVFASEGRIPEIFLRGAGVPDDFIVHIRSLVGRPIQFYSCFLCYSSNDQEFAERLYTDLQANGVRCWFAPEDMKIGDKIRGRIDEAIRVHEKLLLILSENSIRSSWVEKEVETAFEREARENKTILFPIRLDNAVMENRPGLGG